MKKRRKASTESLLVVEGAAKGVRLKSLVRAAGWGVRRHRLYACV
jgi:hypothetical protein